MLTLMNDRTCTHSTLVVFLSLGHKEKTRHCSDLNIDEPPNKWSTFLMKWFSDKDVDQY